jgi:hypothetical protein
MQITQSFADPESRISIATIMMATVLQVLVMGSLIAGVAH